MNTLPSIRLQTDRFEAEILLQGAQLLHFAPRGQRPWLFPGPDVPSVPGRELYGGIPVIFPWFGRLEGQPDAPNHAFVRSAAWKPDVFAPGDSHITLSLTADEVRAQGIDTTLWPYDFTARLEFSFGDTLGIRLEILNDSAETVRFECALHTYFAIEDLDAVRVSGLENQPFRRAGKGDNLLQQGPIRFGQTVTQVFETSGLPVQIHDRHRTYHLSPGEGWHSTIVWNPARAMEQLSDTDARRFVCVEAGAIRASAPTLAPGQTYALDLTIGATQTAQNTQTGPENA